MMDIAILCAVSVIAVVLAWLYLALRQDRVIAQSGSDEGSAERAETSDDSETADRKQLLWPSGKRLAFLIVMLAILCGMSVVLEKIYISNTLVHNMKLLTLLALLFVAANIDARQRIIPNTLVLAGLVLRVAFWIAELVISPTVFFEIFKNDMIACLLVIMFIVVGVLIVRNGLGMGDIKLMLVMCLFQGFYGVVSSLFCSLFVVFVYAVAALLLKKKSKKDSVAFAPAILVGTIISVFLTGI